ncbi:MAG TPA: hypothetical protein VEL76_33260 [Gemmataceae bacterium]|nr:hypothetical protein [Gemmataceae bacterium]
MSMHRALAFVLTVATATGAATLPVGRSQEGQGLSAAEFEKLRRLLQPSREEAWQQLPWKLSLLEARDQAARAKKPVFLLVRSGHPLGCV